MNILEAKDIQKKYKNNIAVKGVDFECKKGQILGVLGPNGAGKTTLLHIVATLIKPDEGDILFKGESIVKKPMAIRPYLGFVPQDIALYNALSVKDNLKFWGGVYGLKSTNLADRIEQVLDVVGLKESYKKTVGSLSGGMKRRLNIAAALVHKPEIVVMDEPTVGIDAMSRECIVTAINNLKKEGVSVIYTSHHIEEAETLCDNIIIMKAGKICASGTVEELRKSSGLFDSLFIKTEKSIDSEKKEKILKLLSGKNSEILDDTINIPIEFFDNKCLDIVKKVEEAGIKVKDAYALKPGIEKVYLEIIKRNE